MLTPGTHPLRFYCNCSGTQPTVGVYKAPGDVNASPVQITGQVNPRFTEGEGHRGSDLHCRSLWWLEMHKEERKVVAASYLLVSKMVMKDQLGEERRFGKRTQMQGRRVEELVPS